jgi:hypothetical protein
MLPNLRTISAKTYSTPEGSGPGKGSDPSGAGRVFSASASVGCTYGYSRELASWDHHRYRA